MASHEDKCSPIKKKKERRKKNWKLAACLCAHASVWRITGIITLIFIRSLLCKFGQVKDASEGTSEGDGFQNLQSTQSSTCHTRPTRGHSFKSHWGQGGRPAEIKMKRIPRSKQLCQHVALCVSSKARNMWRTQQVGRPKLLFRC